VGERVAVEAAPHQDDVDTSSPTGFQLGDAIQRSAARRRG
jgi:hypothetical protein